MRFNFLKLLVRVSFPEAVCDNVMTSRLRHHYVSM